MSSATLPLQKLSQLVKLLASDKEGERLAACGAIARVLKAGGHDLHDLAEFIAKPVEKPAEAPSNRSERHYRTPPPVERVAQLAQLAGEWRARLYPKEIELIDSFVEQHRERRWLSDKQIAVILNIHTRVQRRPAR